MSSVGGNGAAPGDARRVLLLAADYYGTLAAARCYGAAGFHVTMADESPRARFLRSRHAAAKEIHPPIADVPAFLDWLVRFGERHPGTFLYPPNDNLAWLFAREHERLSKIYSMYSPSESAVITLLDKKRLRDACLAPDVGIEGPLTEAQNEGEPPADLAARLRFPVLVKPRTQVFLASGFKGSIVRGPHELAPMLARFTEQAALHPVLTSRYPELLTPIVQEYLAVAEGHILSVSGFVTDDGRAVARSAMKVLQRPPRVGIGLCFESRPVERALVDKLVALCRTIGYHGVFEAEFIVDGDRRLLIDFNPRFYSQMAFDVARGMPLPLLAWHAGRGEREALDDALARATGWRSQGNEIYVHKTMFDLALTLNRLTGQMSKDVVQHWRDWYAQHPEVTDAVRDSTDPAPAIADLMSWGRHMLVHPRSFFRFFVSQS